MFALVSTRMKQFGKTAMELDQPVGKFQKGQIEGKTIAISAMFAMYNDL